MKYSKIITTGLALALSICSLVGCSKENAGLKNGKKAEVLQQVSTSKYDIDVLNCNFADEVFFDSELENFGFTKRDGKVYVNLALTIKNNSEENFNKDDIEAYFDYNDLRYDLQYELMTMAPAPHKDDNILPGCIGTVYMLTLVEETVMDEEITVKVSVDGKDFEEKVSPKDTRDAFSKKTEIKVGDKFNVDGFYDIVVVKCSEEDYVQATKYEKSEQYGTNNGKKFIDLILKVKNNSKYDLEEIDGYVILDDESIVRASSGIEVNNNTSIEALFVTPLKAGQEEYIHIYTVIEENENAGGLAMRFNLSGNCYYCNVK